MRTTTIQAKGHRFRDRTIPRDTSDFIFTRAELHEYEIDNAHFKMKNGMANMPSVVITGDESELNWIAGQMIATADCIWDIVVQFINGATIRFPRKETAAKIYKRITAHMDAHLNAMRTNKMYDPPDPEDFRKLAEFALVCRGIAVDVDADIDEYYRKNNMMRNMPVRAQFSYRDVPEVKKQQLVPKSVLKMDHIERYLEEYHGGG